MLVARLDDDAAVDGTVALGALTGLTLAPNLTIFVVDEKRCCQFWGLARPAVTAD
jgi:hypothetical protein